MSIPNAEKQHRFLVAFSFAASHRETFKKVANLVSAVIDPKINDRSQGRVFFDEWFEHEILAPDMDLYFHGVFHDESTLIVADMSEEYAERAWTQVESRAIRELFLETDTPHDPIGRLRKLSVKFGDGNFEGSSSTEGYLDGSMPPQQMADFIIKRLHLILGEQSTFVSPSSSAIGQGYHNPLVSCFPGGVTNWRWLLVDGARTLVLGWSESSILLWDPYQNSDSSGVKVMCYEDSQLYKFGKFCSVGWVRQVEDGKLRVLGLTVRSELVCIDIDATALSRTSLSVSRLYADDESTLKQPLSKVVCGGIGQHSVYGIFDLPSPASVDASTGPIEGDMAHTLAIAVERNGKWAWLSDSPATNSVSVKAARYDNSGEYLLIVSSGLVFQLFGPMGKSLELMKEENLSVDDGEELALNDFELETMSGPNIICWYSLGQLSSLHCAILDTLSTQFEIHKLAIHEGYRVSARIKDGWPQLGVVEVHPHQSFKGHRDWSIRVGIWTPGKAEPHWSTLETSVHKPEIVTVSFDESTDRLLVVWRAGSGVTINYTSFFPDKSDADALTAVPHALDVKLPSGIAFLNNHHGVAAACSEGRMLFFETQGFSTLDKILMFEDSEQVPFQWLNANKLDTRLITTSAKRVCVWQMPVQFFCRCLPADVPISNYWKLTNHGYVVFGRIDPAQLVVQSIEGQIVQTLTIPEQHMECFNALAGLYADTRIGQDRESVEPIVAFWSSSSLVVYRKENGWVSVPIASSCLGGISIVSFNREFTQALISDKRQLCMFDLWERFPPEVYAEHDVIGASFLDDGHILYWSSDSIYLDGNVVLRQSDASISLSKSGKFLILDNPIAGDERVFYIPANKELPKFTNSTALVDPRLTDVLDIDLSNGVYAACRRGAPQNGSVIEIVTAGASDGSEPTKLLDVPFNAVLISPNRNTLCAFGADYAIAWNLEGCGELPLGKVGIDRGLSWVSFRDCVTLASGSQCTVGLIWGRQDERVCVAQWTPNTRQTNASSDE